MKNHKTWSPANQTLNDEKIKLITQNGFEIKKWGWKLK